MTPKKAFWSWKNLQKRWKTSKKLNFCHITTWRRKNMKVWALHTNSKTRQTWINKRANALKSFWKTKICWNFDVFLLFRRALNCNVLYFFSLFFLIFLCFKFFFFFLSFFTFYVLCITLKKRQIVEIDKFVKTEKQIKSTNMKNQ